MGNAIIQRVAARKKGERKLMAKKPLMSIMEFASLTGIGRNTVYELIREGRIRYIKIGRGGKFLILSSELEDFPEREAVQLGEGHGKA